MRLTASSGKYVDCPRDTLYCSCLITLPQGAVRISRFGWRVRSVAVSAFIWPVRVYYEDTDSGGVVYYANYLKFLERARTEWLRSLGIEQNILLRERQLAFMVRSVTIRYRAPARFNDLLEVHSQIARHRRASVVFEQEVVDPARAMMSLCQATVEVACVDSVNFKPRPLPSEFLAETESGC